MNSTYGEVDATGRATIAGAAFATYNLSGRETATLTGGGLLNLSADARATIAIQSGVSATKAATGVDWLTGMPGAAGACATIGGGAATFSDDGTNLNITYTSGPGQATLGGGNCTITGSAANDSFTTGTGNDTLILGAGMDSVTFGAGTASVTATQGAGHDTYVFKAGQVANVTIKRLQTGRGRAGLCRLCRQGDRQRRHLQRLDDLHAGQRLADHPGRDRRRRLPDRFRRFRLQLADACRGERVESVPHPHPHLVRHHLLRRHAHQLRQHRHRRRRTVHDHRPGRRQHHRRRQRRSGDHGAQQRPGHHRRGFDQRDHAVRSLHAQRRWLRPGDRDQRLQHDPGSPRPPRSISPSGAPSPRAAQDFSRSMTVLAATRSWAGQAASPSPARQDPRT